MRDLSNLVAYIPFILVILGFTAIIVGSFLLSFILGFFILGLILLILAYLISPSKSSPKK